MNVTATTNTHLDAPTLRIQAGDTEFAYRRFGNPADVPLLMLQRFRGSLDAWDPALNDDLAANREIILVDYAGVAGSTGKPAHTISRAAQDIISFAEALGLKQVDLLGYSLGGFVAQEVALTRPGLVRRLVLAGTGPKGAPDMHGWREDISSRVLMDEPGGDEILYVFFAHTETSQAKGMEFFGRFFARQEDRDAEATFEARDAQYDSVLEWGIPDHGALQRLAGIKAPTLVLQGDNDLMIPTKNSHLMAGLIPEATIKIYDDASHGFIYQYPHEVAAEIDTFLA